jgi:hypothetical protein
VGVSFVPPGKSIRPALSSVTFLKALTFGYGFLPIVFRRKDQIA